MIIVVKHLIMDITQKQNTRGSKGLWYSPALNKFFDVKLVPDCIYFASILEFKVYQQLVRYFGRDKIEIHKRVELVPAVKGKNKAITWDIDFFISSHSMYVEAKGNETEVYKIKRELFKYMFPQKILLIVKDADNTIKLVEQSFLDHAGITHSTGGA